MIPLQQAIARFSAIVREEILRDHLLASCVVSTWITVEVFQKLGYAASAREVVASVGNATYVALWRQFGPPKTADELDRWAALGAFVIGVGHDQMLGGIGGHLVCTIDDRVLIDASLDQASQPSQGIVIPPVVSFPIDPRGLHKGIIRDLGDQLFIEYVDRPVIADYRGSPDWGQTPEARDAAARILTRVTMEPAP